MDQILYWNTVALATIQQDRDDVGETGRTLAVLHLAMCEASGPAGLLNPIPEPAPEASRDVAAAVAAHTVLTTLYPKQTARLDTALQRSGAGGNGTCAGSAHGYAVARAVLDRVSPAPESAWPRP